VETVITHVAANRIPYNLNRLNISRDVLANVGPLQKKKRQAID